MKAFWKQWNKGAAAKAVKLFALSVGATALCMLGCLGFLSGGKEPSALEASIFNGGKEFAHQEDSAAAAAAQDTSRQVIPLGSAFGIKLFTDGVIVASLSDIYTEEGVCCPAAEAGILPGTTCFRRTARTSRTTAPWPGISAAARGRPSPSRCGGGPGLLRGSHPRVWGGLL